MESAGRRSHDGANVAARIRCLNCLKYAKNYQNTLKSTKMYQNTFQNALKNTLGLRLARLFLFSAFALRFRRESASISRALRCMDPRKQPYCRELLLGAGVRRTSRPRRRRCRRRRTRRRGPHLRAGVQKKSSKPAASGRSRRRGGR